MVVICQKCHSLHIRPELPCITVVYTFFLIHHSVYIIISIKITFSIFSKFLFYREKIINLAVSLRQAFSMMIDSLQIPAKNTSNRQQHIFSFKIDTRSHFTIQKMKYSIKNFFSKCHQIRRKLRIWSHLPKKSLMQNFNFCAVLS